MTDKEQISFAAEIWRTLSKIDVSGHTKSKGEITFLPWAACWQILMEHYPESYFDCSQFDRYENGSVEIWAKVTIKKGEQEFSRSLWFPVMDYKHQSVKDPTSRQMSDARMRSLVKCIALTTGLGLHLFFSEDYPRLEPAPVAEAPPKITDEQAANLAALIEEVGAEAHKFCAFFGIKKPEALPAARFDEAIKMLEKRRAK